MLDDVAGKSTQGATLVIGAIRSSGNQRAWERLAGTSGPTTDPQRSGLIVDRLDRHRFRCGGIDEAAGRDLVLLGWEAQRMDHRARGRRERERLQAGVAEPGERLVVELRQLLLVGFESFEVRPPGGLCLAPVIVDQLGDQPVGTLIAVSITGVLGDIGGERIMRRVELRLELGVWLPRLGWWLPRDRPAERLDRLVATGEQPFTQQVGGAAVVLVVALDRLKQRAIAGLQEPLEGDDRVATLGHLRVPLLPVKRLDALDRIVRLTDTQPLTHDRVQIDQNPPPQQPIDLLLPRRVQTHQPLDRRRLIRGVVVDMQVGKAPEPLDHKVDEPLKRLLLRRSICGPERLELRLLDL